MNIKSFLSIGFLGSFLLWSSLFCHTLSLSIHETPSKYTTIKQFLIPHNSLRSELGLPPLKWSKKLARFAYWWANQRRGDCSLVHSWSDFGENLFWGSGKDWKADEAVAAWAEERRYYDHKTNSCTQNQDCLHYTQMVWRETLKVGCAKVTCTNYDPHGNVIGQKPF
ncbi:hypothetical protein UlMin_019605 [Ulmus minor]